VIALLGRVATLLVNWDIPVALTGVGALEIHGVSRSSEDLELLTTDARALRSETWEPLEDAAVDVRHGHSDEPLVGMVKLTAAGERDVEVMVGAHAWQTEIVLRARAAAGSPVPVVEAADLILLKLHSGGTQDRWDIEQLLSGRGRAQLIRDVEARVPALPGQSRELWDQLSRSA
jgi:hypothetical protein